MAMHTNMIAIETDAKVITSPSGHGTFIFGGQFVGLKTPTVINEYVYPNKMVSVQNDHISSSCILQIQHILTPR